MNKMIGIFWLSFWGCVGVAFCPPVGADIQPPEIPQTSATQPAGDDPGEGRVVVARLIYGRGKESVCFADTFLSVVARQTSINVRRTLAGVELDSPDLYNYPFVIMSGEGRFTLTDEERRNLKNYLQRGGFLLASAGCSSADWADCFRKEMAGLFPAAPFQALPLRHAIFTQGIYQIDRIATRKVTTDAPTIYGLSLGDRLAVVFSPLGLNDSADAGPGCCCCGGNEIRNAVYINANVLVYVLSH